MRSARELVDEVQQALTAGDRELLGTLITDDVEYVNPPYAAEPGTRRGRDAFLRVFDVLFETFEWSVSDNTEIVESGDEVLVLWSGPLRMRRLGSNELANRGAFLFRRRDDRIASVAWFRDHEEGRAAMATPGR